MPGIDLIRDLAVITAVAALSGWLCRRMGLSMVVGYLLAGIIVGPHTPPFAFVESVDRVQMLADFGLVFLIFSVGMGLSLGRLQRLGLSLVLATAVGALLVLNCCRLLGSALGWPPQQALFLAGMLMVSSSAIIAKVLEELNASHERWGQLALGVTVLEDVVAVVMLTVLTSLARFGGDSAPPIGPTLGKLGAFIVLVLFLSLLVVPRVLRRLHRQNAVELRTLFLVALVLSLAWLATRVGYSLALGAFILGAIVAGTPFRAEVEKSFEALRHTFGAVFFVAIGMLVDPRVLLDAWPLILAASALALIVRPIACALGLIAAGNPNRTALQAGLALTPIGEFSFIIAQLGVSAGVLPPTFSAVAVGVSLVTAVAAPLLMRHSDPITDWIEARQPRILRSLFGFYHERLARLRARQGSSMLWRLTGWRFGQVALHLLFLSSLLLFWQPAYRTFESILGAGFPFPGGLRPLFWILFGILLLGPLIALWRNVEAIAMILADGATRDNPRRDKFQPWLLRGLKVIAALLLIDWLLTLLPLGGASTVTVAIIAAIVLIVALVFGSRLLRWHSRAEGELRAQFRSASNPAMAAGIALPVLDQSGNWDLEIAEVTLPLQSDIAGRRIRDLGLRQATGCSILTLDRNGYTWMNPSGDEALYPGDRLLLLGAPDQLPIAERHLTSGIRSTENAVPFSDFTSESVPVPDGCPHANRPFSELTALREIGVLVCGIQRGRQRSVLPAGNAHFQAGDRLLVVGTQQQILKFRGWLEEGRT